MRASEIKSELIDNYHLQLSSMVWGSPGIGKSDLIREMCSDLKITCKDERIATLDPVDLRGVPSIENGFTLFNIPTLLPNVDRDGEFGIFFLDELPAAPVAMQNAGYQLTLDRKCGDYILPDGWGVIAAGNNLSDKANAHRQSTALANRFGHYDFEVDIEEWLTWAVKNEIDESIIAFIKWRPDQLHDKEMTTRAYRSPRTWEFVNRHKSLMTEENEFYKVSAFVGEATAIEFNHFMKIIRQLPTFDSIIQNPTTAMISDEPSVNHAVSALLMKNVTEQNFEQIMKYIVRIPIEFQAVFTTDAIKRNDKLASTKSFIAWATTNTPKMM